MPTTAPTDTAQNEAPIPGGLTIDDAHYPVIFDASIHVFVAKVGGRTVSGRSWDELREQATTAHRKARVRVEIAFVAPDGRRGVTTGLHASTRHPVIRWANGQRSHGLDVREPLRPDVDHAELERRRANAAAARQALDTFLRDNRLGYSLSGVVQVAISEAAAAQSTTTEGDRS